MDLGLHDKAAFVGGASKGIGKAAALALARERCRVAICSRTSETIEAAASEIREATGAEVLPLVCDMADYNSIRAALSTAAAQLQQPLTFVDNSGGPPPRPVLGHYPHYLLL